MTSHSETVQAAFIARLFEELCDATSVSNGATARSICLTGGRSAKALYESTETRNYLIKHYSNFYFGDERCVESNHPDSNFQLAVRSLFSDDVKLEKGIYRMHGEACRLDEEAERYGDLLPDHLDLLLLSVGEDGHIASLFPGSRSIGEAVNKVVPVLDAPKRPPRRLTITPRVIQSAKKTIVMAAGSEKGAVLSAALKEPDRTSELPVRLTIGSTWVLDSSATESFLKDAPENHLNTRIIYA